MDDRCPHHEAMLEDIQELKVRAAHNEGRITALERVGAGNDERFRTIFRVLDDIKESIRSIAEKLDQLRQRPAHNWDRVVWAIISAVIAYAAATLTQRGAP